MLFRRIPIIQKNKVTRGKLWNVYSTLPKIVVNTQVWSKQDFEEVNFKTPKEWRIQMTQTEDQADYRLEGKIKILIEKSTLTPDVYLAEKVKEMKDYKVVNTGKIEMVIRYLSFFLELHGKEDQVYMAAVSLPKDRMFYLQCKDDEIDKFSLNLLLSTLKYIEESGIAVTKKSTQQKRKKPAKEKKKSIFGSTEDLFGLLQGIDMSILEDFDSVRKNFHKLGKVVKNPIFQETMSKLMSKLNNISEEEIESMKKDSLLESRPQLNVFIDALEKHGAIGFMAEVSKNTKDARLFIDQILLPNISLNESSDKSDDEL